MERRKKRKKKNEIKALIFDVGSVLQLNKENPPRVHWYIANKLHRSLDHYFDAIDTAYAKSITGDISETKAIKTIAKNLEITPRRVRSLYRRAYKKYYKLNKELYRYALQKKKQGCKIAILSDQWYLSKKALVPKKLYKKFDVVIVSCEVRIRKPNPKIYQLTLKRLGLPAKEVIFIDNQEWNTKPAKKLGMKSVLFKNNKQAIKEIEKHLK
jgi:epoxide hydrolase-like predicted phosphatase